MLRFDAIDNVIAEQSLRSPIQFGPSSGGDFAQCIHHLIVGGFVP